MRLLVEEGMTQKQIALQLGRDLVTIKRHSQAIQKRLGGVTLHQAVAIAVIGRLSTVRTYAKLAAKAGVIAAEESILIGNVQGYAQAHE